MRDAVYYMIEDGGGWNVKLDYFCVAYLDLLGQSARLDGVASLPLPVQKDSRLDEQLLPYQDRREAVTGCPRPRQPRWRPWGRFHSRPQR